MIYGKLRVLGYPSVSRGTYSDFNDYKQARDDADAFVLALLAEIERQTGRAETYPPQGLAEAAPPAALGTLGTWLALKRSAAWLEAGESPPPSESARSDPSDDERLRPFLCGKAAAARFPHFLQHAESSGLYLPILFPRPFWLSAHQCSVGSAPTLREELRTLEAALQESPAYRAEGRALVNTLSELAERACRERLAVELFPEEECR